MRIVKRAAMVMASTWLCAGVARAETVTQVLETPWERTVGYYVDAFPVMSNGVDTGVGYPYYASDGRTHVWTSDAWNGPSSGAGGAGPIPDFVPNDYWFYTPDYSGGATEPDGHLQGTYYWFRTTVTLDGVGGLANVRLFDKYHPGKITVNDGLIVFVNGVYSGRYISVSDMLDGQAGKVRDWAYPSTGWVADALAIPTSLFVEGENEIAVAFEERWGDGGLGHLVVEVSRSILEVAIDIKPGSFPNSINLGSNGVVPVAILSGAGFDATAVDPLSVELEGARVAVRGRGTPMADAQDVNGDGLLDLVVQIETEALALSSADAVATLTARTFAGLDLRGADGVNVVP